MKNVLLTALMLFLTSAELNAASYLKTDGSIVAPIQRVANRGGGDHPYNGKNLEEMMDLSNSSLSGAALSRADLTYTNLSDSNLSGANLRDANLTGSDLTGVNLRRANLVGVNLSGTVLKETDFRTANLNGAYYFINNAPQWGNGMNAKNLGIIEKPPEAINRRNPKSTARAILTALRTKDFKSLWMLSRFSIGKPYDKLTPGKRDAYARFTNSQFKGSRWRWGWQAVSTWDGSIGKVVYDGDKYASVEFGAKHLAPFRQEIAVVHLEMGKEGWFFVDIRSLDWKTFRLRARIRSD